mmetsp:Transcript_10519/g.26727  ORF Transcript_10519/g.26727 Transcript_10519/m.26727 type:complete len:410 (+) Transcript_10519:1246-2475(+)
MDASPRLQGGLARGAWWGGGQAGRQHAARCCDGADHAWRGRSAATHRRRAAASGHDPGGCHRPGNRRLLRDWLYGEGDRLPGAADGAGHPGLRHALLHAALHCAADDHCHPGGRARGPARHLGPHHHARLLRPVCARGSGGSSAGRLGAAHAVGAAQVVPQGQRGARLLAVHGGVPHRGHRGLHPDPHRVLSARRRRLRPHPALPQPALPGRHHRPRHLLWHVPCGGGRTVVHLCRQRAALRRQHRGARGRLRRGQRTRPAARSAGTAADRRPGALLPPARPGAAWRVAAEILRAAHARLGARPPDCLSRGVGQSRHLAHLVHINGIRQTSVLAICGAERCGGLGNVCVCVYAHSCDCVPSCERCGLPLLVELHGVSTEAIHMHFQSVSPCINTTFTKESITGDGRPCT